MARGMDYPSLVGSGSAESLVGAVEAPGTSFQAKSYGMNGGLGDVITDITTGNFAQLPSDFINGLNPATLDIGSYLIVGGIFLLMGGSKLFKGGKGASRQASRRARLAGQVAQDQALLKAS
jgi:hypothetical protein